MIPEPTYSEIKEALRRCQEDPDFHCFISIVYKEGNNSRTIVHANNAPFELVSLCKEMTDLAIKKLLSDSFKGRIR